MCMINFIDLVRSSALETICMEYLSCPSQKIRLWKINLHIEILCKVVIKYIQNGTNACLICVFNNRELLKRKFRTMLVVAPNTSEKFILSRANYL